jgi:hypothetical protein
MELGIEKFSKVNLLADLNSHLRITIFAKVRKS